MVRRWLPKMCVTRAKEVCLTEGPGREQWVAGRMVEGSFAYHRNQWLAGDGTTRATALQQAIFTTRPQEVTAGSQPGMDLKKRGIEKAVARSSPSLKKQNKTDRRTAWKKSSRLASGISHTWYFHREGWFAGAMHQSEKEGVHPRSAKGIWNDRKSVEGNGNSTAVYISPYFYHDTEKMEAVYWNPYVLIYVKHLGHERICFLYWEKSFSSQAARLLFIISEDVEGEALALPWW